MRAEDACPNPQLEEKDRLAGDWPFKIPRRVRCVTCGRSVRPQVANFGDGWKKVVMPPHKRKGWWKRKARRR